MPYRLHRLHQLDFHAVPSVVDLTTLNLDPDPEFWPNYDPDPDAGLCKLCSGNQF